VPRVADVRTAIAVLRHLGARVSRGPDGREVIVEARDIGAPRRRTTS
jgi:UDP-N-acetylglucosamine enolpyruvyl transferase